MSRCWMIGLVCLALGGTVGPARADEFERIEGEALAGIARNPDASSHRGLTIAEIGALPTVLRESRSALLIVATDQGNLARMLVSPALRKTPGGEGAPIPVLLLERFDTFEGGNLGTRLARGRDLLLFDGFQVDLDSGQVVPEGQGGDLQFQADPKKEAPRLVALGKATLYTLSKAPLPSTNGPARPSVGRSVVPGDFAGRYRLFANGQWSGSLDIKVEQGGAVSGRFRSDLNGTAYPVDGQVAPDVPNKITFAIKYPRTRQDFEGLLWTEGKGAMAGTVTMLGRAYGFFAVREGGRFAPEGEDVGPLSNTSPPKGRRTVGVRKGQYTLDGKPKTDQELTDALKRSIAEEPATWVLLQVPAEETFSAVKDAFDTIGAAGISTIRLAPADPER